ncbi:hypothetical protein [Paraburkholderia fungorum]
MTPIAGDQPDRRQDARGSKVAIKPVTMNGGPAESGVYVKPHSRPGWQRRIPACFGKYIDRRGKRLQPGCVLTGPEWRRRYATRR